MPQHKLTPKEVEFLQEALNSDYKVGNLRLREGEYQYALAKAIAAFQLELYFPDVKDLIRKLYGEEKVNDVQFIRKVQTILKKMEKSNIVKILPKKKPWELQRYMLSSFKFQDSDKNLVVFANDEQSKEAQASLQATTDFMKPVARLSNTRFPTFLLTLVIILSYVLIVWNITQPIINPIVFVSAFSVATACSVVLGKMLSEE